MWSSEQRRWSFDLYKRLHEITSCSLPKNYEYIVLDLLLGGGIHMTIIGIYQGPSAHLESLEEIAKLWSLHASTELLVMGDLNLDWLSDSSNKSFQHIPIVIYTSNKLKEQCLELKMFQLIDKPIRPILQISFKIHINVLPLAAFALISVTIVPLPVSDAQKSPRPNHYYLKLYITIFNQIIIIKFTSLNLLTLLLTDMPPTRNT